MTKLDVTSIASLEALNSALSQYRTASDEPFHRFAPIFSEKLELLAQLEAYFEEKIRQAERELASAQSAYSACMNNPNRTSCSSEASWVRQAEAALAQAKANLATYKSVMSQLRGSFGGYQGAASRYENNLQNISSSIVPNFAQLTGKMRLYSDDQSAIFGDGVEAGNPINYAGGASNVLYGAPLGGTGVDGASSGGKTANVASGTGAEQAGNVTDNVQNNNANTATETNSNNTSQIESNSSVSMATVGVGGIALTAIAGGFLVNTLKKGKKGMDEKEIKMLQNLLLQKGYDVGRDGASGIFGDDTDKAVKKFQKDNSLKVDGEVGNNTIAALKKDVYNVTYAELKKMFPKAKKEDMIQLESLLVTEGGKFGLTDKKDIALFLAQCGHESNGFKRTEEDFTYSATALPGTFSAFKELDEKGKLKYDPKDYGYTDSKKKSNAKIEDIANIAYANRMGNGDYASGDGYKFRGRGYIQLTGKDNYSSFNTFYKETYPDEKIDFIEKPDSIAQNSKYAIRSSLYYWKNNVAPLKSLTVDSSTRAINPALKGLEDRKNLYEQIVKQLNIT